ncbi:MAG: RNA-binding S4 domain-containing protein [Spongiibacteraceae bacterium]
MRDVEILVQPVELYKILKFEAMVSSGGEAKLAIDLGHVLVNGEVEHRKRKKIVSGDIIEYAGEQLHIVFNGSVEN